MSTYYEILGLKSTASSIEIKEAFRTLAKKYHPDRNPAGKEQFTIIAQAYEVLSDPDLRAAYDIRLKYTAQLSSTQQKTQPGSKEWRFDEREMRRRKYYDEHIRRYEKTSARRNSSPPRVAYNEYRYWMFATPLAVALFLLIMHWAGPTISTPTAAVKRVQTTLQAPNELMLPGLSPYKAHFGKEVFERPGNKVQVINASGHDALICLFDTSAFLRSFFLASDFSAAITQLPNAKLEVRFALGTDFDPDAITSIDGVFGNFKKHSGYFISPAYLALRDSLTITLTSEASGVYERVTAGQFFKKATL